MQRHFLVAALLLALAAIGALLYVARSGTSAPPVTPVALPDRADTTGGSAETAPSDLVAPGASARDRARAVPGAPVANPVAAGARECRLRVSVRLASDPTRVPEFADVPRDLEIQASNAFGVVYDLQRLSPSEFVARGLRPGPYVVVSHAQFVPTSRVEVDVRADADESTAQILLASPRIVRVRWSADDGRPVHEALRIPPDPADAGGLGDARLVPDALRRPASERVRLWACATRVLPPRFAPVHESMRVASWGQTWVVERLDDGTTRVAGAPWTAAEPEPHEPAERPPADTFALLAVDEHVPVYVSVWRGSVRVDGAWVAPDVDEVSFATSPAALDPTWARVRLRALDRATQRPLDGVGVVVDARTATTDTEGRAELFVEPGRVTLAVRSNHHEEREIVLDVEPGAEVDAGDVSLVPVPDGRAIGPLARFATFHVVDADGRPLASPPIRLLPLARYDGLGLPVPDGRVSRTTPRASPSLAPDGEPPRDGIVTFVTQEPGRFVLVAEVSTSDVDPILVDERDFTTDPSRVVAQVVVRKPNLAIFRFPEPPARGTKLAIETPDGLPVLVLDTNEFGIVQTWLGSRTFRAHLVEDGGVTPSITFTVDADPFVFEIRR